VALASAALFAVSAGVEAVTFSLSATASFETEGSLGAVLSLFAGVSLIALGSVVLLDAGFAEAVFAEAVFAEAVFAEAVFAEAVFAEAVCVEVPDVGAAALIAVPWVAAPVTATGALPTVRSTDPEAARRAVLALASASLSFGLGEPEEARAVLLAALLFAEVPSIMGAGACPEPTLAQALKRLPSPIASAVSTRPVKFKRVAF
jgi:hypothetical protein